MDEPETQIKKLSIMACISPNLNITEIVSIEKGKSAGQNITNPTLNNLTGKSQESGAVRLSGIKSGDSN